MLGDLLPPAVMELSVSETGREIDKLVAALSCDIIDDYPTADPRWAESIRQGESADLSNNFFFCKWQHDVHLTGFILYCCLE